MHYLMRSYPEHACFDCHLTLWNTMNQSKSERVLEKQKEMVNVFIPCQKSPNKLILLESILYKYLNELTTWTVSLCRWATGKDYICEITSNVRDGFFFCENQYVLHSCRYSTIKIKVSQIVYCLFKGFN